MTVSFLKKSRKSARRAARAFTPNRKTDLIKRRSLKKTKVETRHEPETRLANLDLFPPAPLSTLHSLANEIAGIRRGWREAGSFFAAAEKCVSLVWAISLRGNTIYLRDLRG